MYIHLSSLVFTILNSSSTARSHNLFSVMVLLTMRTFRVLIRSSKRTIFCIRSRTRSIEVSIVFPKIEKTPHQFMYQRSINSLHFPIDTRDAVLHNRSNRNSIRQRSERFFEQRLPRGSMRAENRKNSIWLLVTDNRVSFDF